MTCTAWHKAPRALTGTSSDPCGVKVKISAGFSAMNACCHVCREEQSHDGNVAVPGATSIRGFLLDPSHAVLDHQRRPVAEPDWSSGVSEGASSANANSYTWSGYLELLLQLQLPSKTDKLQVL